MLVNVMMKPYAIFVCAVCILWIIFFGQLPRQQKRGYWSFVCQGKLLICFVVLAVPPNQKSGPREMTLHYNITELCWNILQCRLCVNLFLLMLCSCQHQYWPIHKCTSFVHSCVLFYKCNNASCIQQLWISKEI